MMAGSDLLQQYGVRLNIIGRTDMLPPDVQRSVAQAEALTHENTRYSQTDIRRQVKH